MRHSYTLKAGGVQANRVIESGTTSALDSSLLATVPASSQACLRKPRDSLQSKGPATGLSGLVHLDANESTTGGTLRARRGQVRDSAPIPVLGCEFEPVYPQVQSCSPAPVLGCEFEPVYSQVQSCSPASVPSHDSSEQRPSWSLLGAISHCLGEISMNKTLARGLVAVGLTGPAVSAFAVDPATAIEAVTTLQGSSAGFGPVMFGLALAVVGIMIGVKWIKRARGAA